MQDCEGVRLSVPQAGLVHELVFPSWAWAAHECSCLKGISRFNLSSPPPNGPFWPTPRCRSAENGMDRKHQ